MAGMAQGAVTSLLGRLTSVLVAEAQLLHRVRGDVEFIKDEMESMNGLLRHLTEAQHRDHQVRAWMKQVISLARDCEGYVELYIRRVGVPREAGGGASGLVGRLRRFLCLLRSIPARHEIGMRIRELKERARDVGDRRQRYGVTVPPAAPPHGARGASSGVAVDHKPGGTEEEEEDKEEEDLRRRELLDGEPPKLADEATRKICTWLLSSPDSFHWPSRRLALIVGRGSAGKTAIVKRVYNDPSVESSFQHKVWVDVGGFDKDHNEVRREMIKQLMMATRPAQEDADTGCVGSSKVDDGVQVQRQLPDCLRRALDQSRPPLPVPGGAANAADLIQPAARTKSLLIVLDAVRPADIEGLLSDLQSKVLHTVRDYTYAVIVTTKSDQGLGYLYSRRTMETRTWYGQVFDVHEPLRVFFRRKAVALVKSEFPPILGVLEECCPSMFALQMFLHLLYVDHNRSEEELDGLRAALRRQGQHQGSIDKAMLVFCYNELPSSHKSCLLYLSIYPQGQTVRRTRLLRRWVAEGLITGRVAAPASTLEDKAERIFDALVARGFVRPVEMETTIAGVRGTGKVKSCAVPQEVHEFIASDVGFMDASSPPDLAHRLSINCGIALPEASSSDILTVFKSVSESPQWQLLKVLDLEDCTDLMKKHKHLTSICKILLLKYLSLRNTDVTQLPNQIERLQCLETLDIRGTEIRSLSPARYVVLPMLKHMLAGRKADSAGNHNNSIMSSSDQLLSTTSIGLPSTIGRMRKLEMLSHVEVSSSNINVLYGIGQLQQLRKLGVILNGNIKGIGLSLLFRQIGQLHDCLRCLSVRIRSNGQLLKWEKGAPDSGVTAPKHLERLTITGLTMTRVLSSWLAKLIRLAKITLCETHFEEDAIHDSLGNLGMLRCLRLLRQSCTGTKLAFRKGEFKRLKSLIVEGGDIAAISFVPGAARNLEIIAWSSDKMDALSGLGHLPKLKGVQLINGDCDHLVKAIEKEVGSNPRITRGIPILQPRHDNGAVLAASTSAP